MGADNEAGGGAPGTTLARMIKQLGPAAAAAERGGNGARVVEDVVVVIVVVVVDVVVLVVVVVVVVVVLGVVVVVGRIERGMSPARSASIASNSSSVPTNRPVMLNRGSWLAIGSGVASCCPKIAPTDARRNLRDGIIK